MAEPQSRAGGQYGGIPAYRKIASDLSWAGCRGGTTSTAYAGVGPAGRGAGPAGRGGGSGGCPDADGPGVSLATLERIVTRLEEDR